MFKTNQDFFDAVRDLATRFEMEGDSQSKDRIYESLGLLNGLTDGWHLFLEKMEEIQHSRPANSDLNNELADIISTTRSVVYRR
jgi:hypothetical protein